MTPFFFSEYAKENYQKTTKNELFENRQLNLIPILHQDFLTQIDSIANNISL
jgi:hypothetical protein